MILKKVKITKYKCYIKTQEVNLEDNITCIVGKNESGKTAFLDAMSKFNYFDEDKRFKYDVVMDYPRLFLDEDGGEETLKKLPFITCTYEIEESIKHNIEKDLGVGILGSLSFSKTTDYEYNGTIEMCKINFSVFIDKIIEDFEWSEEQEKEIRKCKEYSSFEKFIDSIKEVIPEVHKQIKAKFNGNWPDKLGFYIFSEHLSPNLPCFWYYDDYYELPNIIELNSYKNTNQAKIVNALFDLTNIDPTTLTTKDDFEKAKARLEAKANSITRRMFKYWSTNQNLRVQFEIETKPNTHGYNYTPEYYFHIRIYDTKNGMSLPLNSRSKGFNWFFSFLIWFSKIQGKKDKTYILLLDEPGLNLHASAQADLLKFINKELAPNYQIIYTTHSPFMIENDKLHTIRTVFSDPDPEKGSIISDSIQEKDSDTLFPLQAALGYDIAQNLFINRKNLLIEGVSDLMYISVMSGELKKIGKSCLREDICLVPVGGLNKVTSFLSLLRGQKLEIACLLDNEKIGKQSLDNSIKAKLVNEKKVRFIDEFSGKGFSDIEDLFEPEEYLHLYNSGFSRKIGHSKIDATKPILKQISDMENIKRFNHYIPANELLKIEDKAKFLSKNTIDRFEKMFIQINVLFD